MTCPYCHGAGCGFCAQWPGAAPSKPQLKVGDLHASSCKRCKNAGHLRIVKATLDKLELFCKLCGKEQEVKR